MRNIVFTLLLGTVVLSGAYGQTEETHSVVVTKDLTLNVENVAVAFYMNNVSYEPGDASVVGNYVSSELRGDWPQGIELELPETTGDRLTIVCCDDETLRDSLVFCVSTENKTVSLCNFIPQRTYRYKMTGVDDEVVEEGLIRTRGQVRMLRIPGTVNNARDLGGWKTTDGKRIRYGKMFRGSELNGTYEATEEGIALLRQLGVEAEIDLRAWYNDQCGVSAFGFQDASSTAWGEVPTFFYSNDSGQLPEHLDDYYRKSRWRMQFDFIVKNLREERCIYEHCVQGKDRTGYLSFLLEGLLGVAYSDLIKDYELTYFYVLSESKKAELDEVYEYINALSGETLRDKFNTYFVNRLGCNQSDINYFRSVMLEDVPGADAPGVVTGIDEVQGSKLNVQGSKLNVQGDFYDLQGRKVSRPSKGLYIVGGKKIEY